MHACTRKAATWQCIRFAVFSCTLGLECLSVLQQTCQMHRKKAMVSFGKHVLQKVSKDADSAK